MDDAAQHRAMTVLGWQRKRCEIRRPQEAVVDASAGNPAVSVSSLKQKGRNVSFGL
jgi:hypothetical protein